MKRSQSTEFIINRLKFVIDDPQKISIAYPILADHGLMEKTPNGFKSIDPRTIINRTKILIQKLQEN